LAYQSTQAQTPLNQPNQTEIPALAKSTPANTFTIKQDIANPQLIPTGPAIRKYIYNNIPIELKEFLIRSSQQTNLAADFNFNKHIDSLRGILERTNTPFTKILDLDDIGIGGETYSYLVPLKGLKQNTGARYYVRGKVIFVDQTLVNNKSLMWLIKNMMLLGMVIIFLPLGLFGA